MAPKNIKDFYVVKTASTNVAVSNKLGNMKYFNIYETQTELKL